MSDDGYALQEPAVLQELAALQERAALRGRETGAQLNLMLRERERGKARVVQSKLLETHIIDIMIVIM